jgi:DNA polymerase I-like protein with 3'-5' exonuclease and polymerase domains
MKKICVIDKAPSRNRYSEHFEFEHDLFHMSSVAVPKLLKKDVDLVVDLDPYDLVILVGSEPAKEYAKISSVTNYAGQLMHDKFICISNPAILHFKPEGKEAFKRAVDRIHKYISGEVVNASNTGTYLGIIHTADAVKFLKEVLENAQGYVAMDTETTCLYPRDGYVLGLSISYKDKHGAYISTDCLDEECMKLLKAIIAKYSIIFHNMKFDIKMIEYHLGLVFDRSKVHDTMCMHYCLDENESHGLKPLALKYTDYGDYDSELDAFKKAYCARTGISTDDFTYDLIPFDVISKYAAIDTAVTLALFHKFWPILQKNQKILNVYNTLMIPGTLFLMDMEEVGIPIDRARMTAAEGYLDKWIAEAKQEVYGFDHVKNFEADAGIIFNPNSVQQLRKVLFDYVKLAPIPGKLTATGAISTDAEVLTELAEQHPLPAAILKVRQLGKMKNTYISKILPELDRDDRIRTNFNLIFTTSGRLSSSGKFNAQQIPRDDPIIKGCIKAPEGYKIVSQDLQTGEMYYAAVLSNDKNLQQVFINKGDFHSTIAKMVFDLVCDVADVKNLFGAMRQSAKAISFGILYGSGPQKVSDTVTKATGEYYGIDRAKDDIKAYFDKFSKLKSWLNSRKTFIETNGFTYSFFGRKRRLINVFSTDKGIAAHEVRSGINAEVQSLCSDINLLGAIDTANEIKAKKLDAKIFMLVHDSIVAIVKDEDVEEYCEILKRNTQKDRGCSIPGAPIGVDQDVGQDYSFDKFEKRYTLEDGILVKVVEE